MAAQAAKKAARPIVLSGPSGAGKSTVLKAFMEKHGGDYGFSTSHTTRAPRPGETNGQHYHFVSRPEFENLISNDHFIEHATFNNNYYGTSFASISALQDAGVTPLLDIEMNGVKNIKRHPDWREVTRFVFVSPPSLEVLESRLKARGDTKDEEVAGRMEQAKVDMEAAKEAGLFDKVIINKDKENACKEFEDWVIQG